MARTSANDEGLSSDALAQSANTARTSPRQSSGNGGLLGGVTGTVGNVVNTTTQTAGRVVGGTTSAVGNTVGNVTESVGGVRISESSDTSVEGGSTLSLTGNNLHLEKGTTFNLRLSQSASEGKDNQ